MPSTVADLLASLASADADSRLATVISWLRGASTPQSSGLPPLSPPEQQPPPAEPAPFTTAERLVLSDHALSTYSPSSDADLLAGASSAIPPEPPRAGAVDAATLLDRAIRLAYECGLRDAKPAGGETGALFSGARQGAPARAPLRALTCIFDLLVEGVLVVARNGRMVYLSPALSRVLREDDESDALLHRMRRLALALPCAPLGDPRGTSTCEMRTGTARYRLRATWAEDEEVGAERSAVVTLERVTQRLPSGTSLMDLYGLTAREAGVALLLAQGYSNASVARKLQISSHTARHHTENVLLKMGVHSRAEVGPKVLGTRRSSAPIKAIGDTGAEKSKAS